MRRFIVDVLYYTLFIPLMMLPILGWGVLIALGNLKERMETWV